MYGTLKEDRIHLRDLNFRLIIYVLALSVIGVMVVNSATANETSQTLLSTTVKQIIGVGLGILLMTVFSLINFRKLVKYAWLLYGLIILALLYVLFFASAIYGANRWIYIPLFGTIQPSEFAKPVLLLALTFIVFKLEDKISKVWALLLYFLAAAPVLILVLKEPDLSTTIVLAIITLSVLFIGGLSYKWIIGALCIMVPVIVFFIFAVYQTDQPILHQLFEDHQVLRINAFFFPDQYPDQVYQQNNSIMAIGSGGLFGKGLNTSSLESVKNGSFLSEEQCDFIFAVVGEELGFVGSCVIIALELLITLECYLTARRCNEKIGKIIAGSIGTALFLQSFINIGVATLIIPNTGIPLPFVSAGMSSLLSSYIMIGMVLSTGLWGRTKQRVYR